MLNIFFNTSPLTLPLLLSQITPCDVWSNFCQALRGGVHSDREHPDPADVGGHQAQQRHHAVLRVTGVLRVPLRAVRVP